MINSVIEEALKDLNVPVSFSIYRGNEKTYITYVQNDEVESFHANDQVVSKKYNVDVDIFSNVNYKNLLLSTKTALRNKGFLNVVQIGYQYEVDTDLHHVTINANYYEEE